MDMFLNSLDKNSCYTFNIQHPHIHKFNNFKNIWFVQSINILTNKVNENPFKNIHPQVLLPYSSQNSHNLLFTINGTNKNSLNEYLYNNNDINLGYILKSSNQEVTGIHSNIIIESSLLKKIRQLLYNNKYIELSKKHNTSKDNIVIISSYLDINNSNIFTKFCNCMLLVYNHIY